MRIAKRDVDNVVVLDMSGKITTGEPARLLNTTFRELLDQGHTRFVFNMLKVPRLDSGSIGEVVACYRRALRKKGVVRLALKGRAHDLFTMMSLEKVFNIFQTVEEALASLEGWQPSEVPEIEEPD